MVSFSQETVLINKLISLSILESRGFHGSMLEEFILLGSDPMALGSWGPYFPKEHGAIIFKSLEV